MTRGEIRWYFLQYDQALSDAQLEIIERIVEDAVQREREDCAKLCEQEGELQFNVALDCATAIRRRDIGGMVEYRQAMGDD